MKTTEASTMPHGVSTHLRRQQWLARALLGGSLAGSATLAMAVSGAPAGAALRHQSTTKLVRAAYSQTVDAKTAKMTLTETVDQNSLPLHVTISGQGSVDFTTGNGALSFSSSATGSFADRFISPNLYIQLPAADKGQLPSGKPWISINLNTVTEAKLGASLAQLSSTSQQSTQLLSYLQSVSSTGITTVGPATIKGVATTEYKATVDLTKVADQKSPAEQASIKSLEAKLDATMLPVQVWLDAQGRVRQVSEQVQVSTTTQSSGGTTVPAASGSVSTTVDYYDFGTPVTVQAPPSSQVDDITSQALAASSTTTTTG
jgi:hypothetical protein